MKKCHMFNKYFHSVFTVQDKHILHEPNNRHPSEGILNSLTVTECDVYKELSKLDVNKAVGPDNFSAILLKECRNELKDSICRFPKVLYQTSGVNVM